ncbi:hypothetical protein K435DRAFT_789650 [Dendrothele bispora CBS 962.96]|uniref:Aminoglycoside phosphotransferase domain-containing protein n=1 Tax=Dendrothele bispora (strain CBS 962.96) TaxID=1314807 RepID=A0A4V4HIE6_DENBC|nr:hypothetical protein K435DRAFT_789650 [Dendrothele bispora CBS 962.96]
MPTLIEKLSPTAALKEAQNAARSYYISEPISARTHADQGMFSRTIVVTLADNTEVIVQLKDNELDTTKIMLARSLLGDVVPDIHAAKPNKVYFAYVAPLIRGVLWDKGKWSLDQEISAVSQIARLLFKCSLGIDSAGIVDYYIFPRLRKILEKEEISDELRTRLEKLHGAIEQLKNLPLCLCHADINERNIIMNDDAEIVGLLDWEMASLLPLGMNACYIRALAVPTVGGKDCPSEKSQLLAEAFWRVFTANLSPDVLPALVVAMQFGMVFRVFYEGITVAPNVLSALPERLDWFERCFGPLCGA